jgi:N-acetylmuramoyl-L-alanine amidase
MKLNGRKNNFIVPIVLVVLFIFATLTPAASAKKLVVIDPAHGGRDRGTKLTDKVSEKDVTLTIARWLQKEIAADKEIEVKLTRDSDRDMPVAERIAAVKALHPDMFISLHVNAGFGMNASGFEFYFPGFKAAASENAGSGEILRDMASNRSLNESVRLAQVLQKPLGNVFPRKGRGLREAPFQLLGGMGVPAVVVELGFATNEGDRNLLTDDKTVQKAAKALAAGIKEYF